MTTETKSAPARSGSRRPAPDANAPIARERLIELLNEDLAREYQAVISYVVYSQMLKGAAYMTIASELEEHAHEELRHALTIAKQIDYLGGVPCVTPLPVQVTRKADEMLAIDLDHENETIRHYRERVRQCEALGEYAVAEHLRNILVDEQEHQIDLTTALGWDVSPAPRTPEEAGEATGNGASLAGTSGR